MFAERWELSQLLTVLRTHIFDIAEYATSVFIWYRYLFYQQTRSVQHKHHNMKPQLRVSWRQHWMRDLDSFTQICGFGIKISEKLWMKKISILIWRELYRMSQKSGTLDFRYFEIWKYSIFWFHWSDKTLSSEKNDTKILWFGLVVLILQPFLETQSFTNFVRCAQAIYGGYSCP